MALKIRTTPTFDKPIKKLHAQHGATVDEVVRKIAEKPTIGDAKKGDLSGVSVYKFKINKQEILLSYSVNSDELWLLTLRPARKFLS